MPMGATMKAHHSLAVVTFTVLLGGIGSVSAWAEEPVAPQQPTAPQQNSKAEADAARKAARARIARCKVHPEICRQQPPK
jgi:hypothetical protein